MAFTDNFQRGNGALGANWITSANLTILNGRPHVTTSAGRGTCVAVTQAGAQDCSLTLDTTVSQWIGCQPIVKSPDANNAGYQVVITGTSGAYTLSLRRQSGASVELASALCPISVPNPTTLRITYNQGDIFFFINGVQWIWYRDTVLDTNTRTGMAVAISGDAITQFTTETVLTASFAVSPSQVQAGGSPTLLTLVGSNTAWVAGVPGTPTFTASAGSLSGQVVGGPTTASVWFAPPATPQTVTIHDPSSGLDAFVACTASAPPPGGEGFAPLLTPEGAALINTTALSYYGDLPRNNTILIPAAEGLSQVEFLPAITDLWSATFRSALHPGAGQGILELLSNVLMWQAGGYLPTMATPAPPSQTTIKEDLTDLIGRLDTLITSNQYTLGTTITTLTGEGAKTHLDILNAIGTADLSPVLDLLQAMRGDNSATLSAVEFDVATIRTADQFTLKTVLDAIADKPVGSDAAAVAAVIALGGLQAAGFAAVLAAIAALEASIAALAVEVAGLSGITDLIDLLSTVAELLANLPQGGGNYLGPPVWPGESGVTYGQSVGIAPGVTVTAPMDGILVSIAHVDDNTAFWRYDQTLAYRHVGSCTFFTEHGEIEPAQALNFPRAIFTPKTMRRAAGCIVRGSRGATGLITPWTIT